MIREETSRSGQALRVPLRTFELVMELMERARISKVVRVLQERGVKVQPNIKVDKVCLLKYKDKVMSHYCLCIMTKVI